MKQLKNKRAVQKSIKSKGLDPDENLCKCGKEVESSHLCPYKREIDNDEETTCNCCDDCTNECSNDI